MSGNFTASSPVMEGKLSKLQSPEGALEGMRLVQSVVFREIREGRIRLHAVKHLNQAADEGPSAWTPLTVDEAEALCEAEYRGEAF